MIENLGTMMGAVGDFLQRYWAHILSGIAAPVAAVGLSAVMRRLDQGAVEGIGASLSGIALLFVAMIVAVNALSGGPHAPYGAALVVLSGGVILWFTHRLWFFLFSDTPTEKKPWQDRVRVRSELDALASSSALLLVVACSLLLAILWIVGVGVQPPQAQAQAQPAPLTPTDFLARAAAAGLLAMAIIQGIRTLVPIRGAFHRASLQRWVSDSAKAAEKLASPADVPTAVKETPIAAPQKPSKGSHGMPDEPAALLLEIAGLASPASGSQRYALFDLPIEQLCGQIAAGADRLLDNPPSAQAPAAVPASQTPPETTSTSPVGAPESPKASASNSSAPAGVFSTSRVLRALAASSDDVERFLELSEPTKGPAAAPPAPPAPDPTESDANAETAGQNNIDENEREKRELERQKKERARQKEEQERQKETLARDSRERMRLRANISQRIQRNIDRLQIDTTFWWKRLLRGLAVAVCAVLGLSALNGSLSAVVFAIVGGFVATVARDVVAIIEKSRR